MPEDSPFTHVDDAGDVRMVDVGDKPVTDRRAVARGTIRLDPETVEAVEADELGKGDVLAVARVAAIQAAKHTWETVPLCHAIPITNVDVSFAVAEARVDCEVGVETTAPTGCEMEAIQAVTTGLTAVWDGVKAAEKDDDGEYPSTGITDVTVVSKTTGDPSDG